MNVAVCPHPPMLVPEIARGAAKDVAELRDACDAAVRELLARDETVTVIGSAAAHRTWGATAGGSFDGFGVRARAGGPDGGLPLSLTVGAWLLDRAGWRGDRRYVGVTGSEIVDVRGSLLVMGDGTAKRSEEAPGHADDRAAAYDKLIAEALAAGDAETLAGLDLDLATRLWAHGVPALCVLGRTVAAAGPEHVQARLRYDAAPFGVGYFVADWEVSVV